MRAEAREGRNLPTISISIHVTRNAMAASDIACHFGRDFTSASNFFSSRVRSAAAPHLAAS
jgi:hypothetical protein